MKGDLARSASAKDSFVLEGATLIDGTGRAPLPDSLVVVCDGRIEYAGTRADELSDLPLRRHCLSGKTIVPGLIEAHTHACNDADMLAYVRNGVTSVRFAGFDQRDVVALRGRIERGEIAGPRLFSCGPMIDCPPVAYPDWSVPVRDPREAAAVATRLIEEEGIDALILTQRVSAPVMRAVCEAAHALGKRVLAQTWEIDGAEAAAAGIDELHNSSRVFHSASYPRERLLAYKSIAERLALSGRGWATIDWEITQDIIDAMLDAGVSYCGMQIITQFQLDEGGSELSADPHFASLFEEEALKNFLAFIDKLQGTWTDEDFVQWRIANENRMEWMRRFRAGGGQFVFGTDMQFGGIMLHRELRNALDLGLTPLEVIASATGGSARVMGVDAEVGTITSGRRADLVVLNRDPNGDLGALRDIHSVFRDGRILWSEQAIPAPVVVE